MERLYTVQNDEIVEVSQEDPEPSLEEVPIEVTMSPSPTTNRVLMKSGESVVEVESAEDLRSVVDTAAELFKQVQHPEGDRRLVSSGFGSYERAPEG